jgi:hypothetical protein
MNNRQVVIVLVTCMSLFFLTSAYIAGTNRDIVVKTCKEIR